MQVQELHSLVAQDMGLHSRAEDPSPDQTHRSAEGGTPRACLAEVEAAAGAQGGLVVLEAGDCSGPWRLEASVHQEGEDLSGRGMAGMEGAAVGVASDEGTGQRRGRLEEDQEVGRTLVERKEVVLWGGRSLGQGEGGLG